MEKHGVIRTDLMMGTDVGTHLVSFRFFDGTGDNAEYAAIDNGNVVALGDLMDGERELYKAAAPAANTALDTIAIVATPEVIYESYKKNLYDFQNEAGQNCRGYRLHKHDVFSVTAEALNIGNGVTPDVGYVAELMAGTKLNIAASATNGSTQVGTIIAIDTVGIYTYYVIRVD